MIAAWIAYSLLVGALLVVMASATDRLCRMRSWPTRWPWVIALLATIALTLAAPRTDLPTQAVTMAAITQLEPPPIASSPTRASLLDILQQTRERVTSSIERGLASAGAAAPRGAGQVMIIAWLSLSALVAGAFGYAYLSVRRMRRRWPRLALHGTTVRVSPNLGPAVIGLARPEIVVPQWLLDEPDDAQQLVIGHEREHVRARDPWLLAGGCAAVICLPWNPSVWWMLSRLRLTTEVDCDARVLRAGTPATHYGAMLVHLAGRAHAFPLGVAALADRQSHLERRIRAMTTSPSRRIAARASVLAAFALVGLLVACEVRLPTTAEIEQMDGKSTEKLLIAGTGAANARYYIDGVPASAAEVKALSAEEVMSVGVAKGATSATVFVETQRGPTKRVSLGDVTRIPGVVYYIDGVRSTETEATALDPNAINEIQILKQRNGPDGVSTPVYIDTKRAAEARRRNPSTVDTTALASADLMASPAVYYIDGIYASAADAKALRPAGVARVSRFKPSGGGAELVDIETKARRGEISATDTAIVAQADATASDAVYYIDGVRASAAAGKALRSADVVSVSVYKARRGAPAAVDTVRIRTNRVAEARRVNTPSIPPGGAAGTDTMVTRATRADPLVTRAARADPMVTRATRAEEPKPLDTFAGITVINGKIADEAAIQRMNKLVVADNSRLLSMKLIKRAEAITLYPNDPRAKNGVIVLSVRE